MAAWLPVTASVLAVTGLASGWASLTGGDCADCTAPAASPAAVIAPVETFEAEAGPVLEESEVYVLKFHADWCPRCKSLDPVYNAVSKSFSEKPVGFVKLDVTNDSKKKEAGEKMKELGLEELWKANKGKNGFLMLVDAGTKESVKVLKAGTTEEQATKAINDALEG